MRTTTVVPTVADQPAAELRADDDEHPGGQLPPAVLHRG